MDKELRDSLMEWYITHGIKAVNVDRTYLSGGVNNSKQMAFNSSFIRHKQHENGQWGFYLTPEGIEALKNGI